MGLFLKNSLLFLSNDDVIVWFNRAFGLISFQQNTQNFLKQPGCNSYILDGPNYLRANLTVLHTSGALKMPHNYDNRVISS